MGLALMAGSYVWFYFHGWQAVKTPPNPRDSYPPIAVDYYPPFAERLADVVGLALFLGGLTFGLSRSAYRFVRRLLSPAPRVR
jgi:hypothetical protein